MATYGDVRIVDHSASSVVPTYQWQVASGAASSIVPGKLLKQSGTAGVYATLFVDGDHTVATDQPIIGLSASISTDTAAADGYVDVFMPLPGVVYGIKALTASLANTQAKIDAMRGKAYVVDVDGTTGKVTLDTAAGNTATNALKVVGGDPAQSELYVVIRMGATFLDSAEV